MKKNLLKIGAIILSLVPVSAMAQDFVTTNFSAFVDSAITLMNTKIIPVIIAAALVVFLWGVLTFIKNADNDAGRKKGRDFILWGLIGLFVMFSVWGLIYFLSETFGFSNSYRPTPPVF